VQRKLFWKLALTFLALLLSVLLAVDFLAERALRGSYQNDVFNQLKAIARVLPFEQLHFSSFPPETPEDLAVMKHWVADAAKSGARISVITADGRVIADSQSETQTMNHTRTARSAGGATEW